jgi:hypothetical protein
MKRGLSECYESMIVWKYIVKNIYKKSGTRSPNLFLTILHDIVIWTQNYFGTREPFGLWGPLWGSEVEVKVFLGKNFCILCIA